jgi:Xaa-Pro aminopeptidase
MNQYIKRIKKVMDRVEDHSLMLLFSGAAKHKTQDQSYEFTVNRHFFYLTGLDEQDLTLALHKDGEKVDVHMFIVETTELMAKWDGERLSKEDVVKQLDIKESNVHFATELMGFVKNLMSFGRRSATLPPKNLYLNLYRYNEEKLALGLDDYSQIVKAYPELTIKNIEHSISLSRMIKSDEEINDIKQAITYTKNGLDEVMNRLSSLDNEHQVMVTYESSIRMQGSRGTSFHTISASGAHATVLHYDKNNGPLDKNNCILLDLGALHNNYASDITRVYPIGGTYSDRQKQLYEIVLDVNKRVIEYAKPGVTWKDMNTFANQLLSEHLMAIDLIKDPKELTKYYYHSIGHFLGLDVHDVGINSMPFEAGMVITVEPGLYIAEEGIGIRIEDDVLITKDGSLNLSSDIIKEVKDIEERMKNR